MATEKTRFDDWLKENLWRDLIFRAFAWVTIALLSAYFSLSLDASSANEYFKNSTNSILRLCHFVGTTAIALGMIALMFKDLEQASPLHWGRETPIGGIGGLFRRLAGDLTLWTLGAFVSVLLAVTIFGCLASGSWKDWAIFSFMYATLLAMCFAVGFLNVRVRREEAFLVPRIKDPAHLLGGYVAAIVGLPAYLFLHS